MIGPRRYLPNFDYDEWRPSHLNLMSGADGGDANGGSDGGFGDGVGDGLGDGLGGDAGGFGGLGAGGFGDFSGDAASFGDAAGGLGDGGFGDFSGDGASIGDAAGSLGAGGFGGFSGDAAGIGDLGSFGTSSDNFGDTFGFDNFSGDAASLGPDASFGDFGTSSDNFGNTFGFDNFTGDAASSFANFDSDPNATDQFGNTFGFDNFTGDAATFGQNSDIGGFYGPSDTFGALNGMDQTTGVGYLDGGPAGYGFGAGWGGYDAGAGPGGAFGGAPNAAEGWGSGFGSYGGLGGPGGYAGIGYAGLADNNNLGLVGFNPGDLVSNMVESNLTNPNDIAITGLNDMGVPNNPGIFTSDPISIEQAMAGMESITGRTDDSRGPAWGQTALSYMDPGNPNYSTTAQQAAHGPYSTFGGGPGSLGLGVSEANPASVGGYWGALSTEVGPATAPADPLNLTEPNPEQLAALAEFERGQEPVSLPDVNVTPNMPEAVPTPEDRSVQETPSVTAPSDATGGLGGNPNAAPTAAPGAPSGGPATPGAPGQQNAPSAPPSAPGGLFAPGPEWAGAPAPQGGLLGPQSDNAPQSWGQPGQGPATAPSWMDTVGTQGAPTAPTAPPSAPSGGVSIPSNQFTFFAPGAGGIEGGRGTALPGPNGKSVARTVEDYLADKARGVPDSQNYISIAAVNGRTAATRGHPKGQSLGEFLATEKGKAIIIPEIRDGRGNVVATNVRGVVHDRGGGVAGVPAHYDIPAIRGGNGRGSAAVSGYSAPKGGIVTTTATAPNVGPATSPTPSPTPLPPARPAAKIGEQAQETVKGMEKAAGMLPGLTQIGPFRGAAGNDAQAKGDAAAKAAENARADATGRTALNVPGGHARSEAPTSIVTHFTGGKGYTIGSLAEQMAKGGAGYSYAVDKNGRVFQLRGDDTTAGHVGGGKGNTHGINNDNSIGVAALAENESDLTPAQIKAMQDLVAELGKNFNIPPSRVFGHAVVSPGRRGGGEGSTVAGWANNLSTWGAPGPTTLAQEGPGRAVAPVAPQSLPALPGMHGLSPPVSAPNVASPNVARSTPTQQEQARQALDNKGRATPNVNWNTQIWGLNPGVVSPPVGLPGVPALPVNPGAAGQVGPGGTQGDLGPGSTLGDLGPDPATALPTEPSRGAVSRPGEFTAGRDIPHNYVGEKGQVQSYPTAKEAMLRGMLGPLYDLLAPTAPGPEQYGPIGPSHDIAIPGLNDMGAPNNPGLMDGPMTAPAPIQAPIEAPAPDVAQPIDLPEVTVASPDVVAPTSEPSTSEPSAPDLSTPTTDPGGLFGAQPSAGPSYEGVPVAEVGGDSIPELIASLAEAADLPMEDAAALILQAERLAKEAHVSLEVAMQIIVSSQQGGSQGGRYA